METGINTILSNGLHISLDWLSWSYPDGYKLENVIKMMGYTKSDFRLAPSGRNGYKGHLHHITHSISILFDGSDNMGIHVDVSGSAIGDLISHFQTSRSVPTPFNSNGYEMKNIDSTVFSDLLSSIMYDGHITRMDLAVDDMGANYYTLPELNDIFFSGSYISRFRKWKNLAEYESGNQCIGYTIYMGSRTSEIMLRIYDKKLEQNQKLKKLNKEPIIQSWVRWELELKSDRAQSAAEMIVHGQPITLVTIGILSNYLRIIDLDNVRKERCSVSEKWKSFLNGIFSCSLYIHAEPKTLDQVKSWMMKQVACSLATIVIAQGGDSSFIHKLLDNGRCRLSTRHLKLIQGATEAVL